MNPRTDKIIGQKLRDAEQAYPADLWEQIAPRIPAYKARRSLRWLPFVLAAGLLTSIALGYWIVHEQPAAETGETDAGLTAALLTTPETKPVSQGYGFSEKEIQNSSAGALGTAVLTDPDHAEANAGITQFQPISVLDAALDPDLEENLREMKQMATPSPAANSAGWASLPAPDATESATGDPEDSDRREIPEGTHQEIRHESHHPILSGITTPAISLVDNRIKRANQMTNIAPDPNCYSFGKRHQSNFTVDVYSGLGIAMRPMTSGDEDVSNYINAREETESFKYLFTFGARINMMMNSGLAIRGGLHYTQIGEKFDYTDTSAVRIITIIDTTFVGGDTIVDVTQEVQDGTLIKKINNRFHSVDIPILIGYDVPLGRLQASVSAGPVINISAWQRGQFLSPALEPVFIETDNPDYYPAYKTNLGIGAYLSASLAMPISEWMWLFAEPYVLHRFNPVTLEEYSIRQRNTNAGVNVGLKLKI